MNSIKEMDKNLSILLVDDYSSVRRVVKNCLAKLGFKNVIEAEDGSSALDKISENKFDLVISDWHMPDMYAATLMEKINVSAALVPCIMLVTVDQKKQLSKDEIPENSDYVVKPFTVATLEDKICKLLSRSTIKQPESSPEPLWSPNQDPKDHF
jgi:two-component system chemotaxis response regulator CheY